MMGSFLRTTSLATKLGPRWLVCGSGWAKTQPAQPLATAMRYQRCNEYQECSVGTVSELP